MDWEGHRLTSSDVDLWVDGLLPSLLSVDHPLLSTVRMQVDFELRYALQSHLHSLVGGREEEGAAEAGAGEVLGLSASRSARRTRGQSPDFYSALFALCLHSDGAATQARDERKLQREVAAALESVFPLPHLFAMAEKGRGGEEGRAGGSARSCEGHPAVQPPAAQGRRGADGAMWRRYRSLNEELQKDIEREATLIGEIAQSYADVVHAVEGGGRAKAAEEGQRGHEEGQGRRRRRRVLSMPLRPLRPPSPFSRGRVHCELIHRRQYLLFLHSLQADGAESAVALQFDLPVPVALFYSQLTAIVGLRSSVPKHAVFPLFQQVAAHYERVVDEEQAGERAEGFVQPAAAQPQPLHHRAFPSEHPAGAREAKRKTVECQQPGSAAAA